MRSSAVDELRELARRDGLLAEESERTRALTAAVAEVRARAEAIAAFFEDEADEDRHLRRAAADATLELDARRAEQADAAAELERASSDEQRDAAQRRVGRASDRVELALRNLERVRGELEALRRTAEELTLELPELELRAREVAGQIGEAGAPGGGSSADLVEWASRAHAVLFVASSQLDAQRERVIREAGELASSVLGEATYGLTAAQALARVERAALR
ncbi:MAG: hypothetical protein M3P41_15775 [Actinomycetota bacterium]|nr:hypothetical protein [Actinomycetota bacterium]